MYFVLFTFMLGINVFCFVYVYVGYQCILFCLSLCRISMYFVCFPSCRILMYFVWLCRMSMYFVLFTFMQDINVFCVVNIYVGY